MAKGTEKQRAMAEEYDNPRIGACEIPHCKSLLPMKGRFHGMCWWHYCRVGYWAKKVGYDLSWAGDPFAADYHEARLRTICEYCAWLAGG